MPPGSFYWFADARSIGRPLPCPPGSPLPPLPAPPAGNRRSATSCGLPSAWRRTRRTGCRTASCSPTEPSKAEAQQPCLQHRTQQAHRQLAPRAAPPHRLSTLAPIVSPSCHLLLLATCATSLCSPLHCLCPGRCTVSVSRMCPWEGTYAAACWGAQQRVLVSLPYHRPPPPPPPPPSSRGN